MLYTVRVRGIYATALSLLLHKKGFLLSDVSKVLLNRLPIIPSQRTPEVTVKSLEKKLDYLLVIGYPWDAGESVFNTLIEELPYVIARRGSLGLYTVFDGVSMGDCIVKGPNGVEALLDSGECPSKGARVRVTVVRESLEKARKIIVKDILKVVGQHVIITRPGTGVTFSEHIRNDEVKSTLLSLLQGIIDLSNNHVHFRSGAKLAQPTQIENEVKSLLEELEKLESTPISSEERIVRRGEFIGILGLPSPTKEYLDEIRRTVTPTIDKHHSLKSFGDESSMLVDCAETQISIGGDIKGYGIEYYFAKRDLGRFIILEHHKPDGEVITLGRYHVETVRLEEEQVVLEISKKMKSRGVLDGLGVEKRPGDMVKTKVRTGEWYIIHEYYTPSGSLLGVYANVNTPVEIGPSKIKYFDLYIDVVKKPGKEPEIIDAEELEKALELGLVSSSLYKQAIETAQYLKRKLSSTYL
ncbi:MAG: DUF402 domain-containing protein [Desulfurococcales archaeon]|nr:DUF402 domain-containing protein [Desulfurococcales archaeon]